MGGRGASSASANHAGLPNGAVAFTFGGKQPMTFYQANGVVLRSRSARSTQSGDPISTNMSLAQLYENAKASGLNIELHTPAEMERANASVRTCRNESQRDIAYAELHPGAGKTGINAKRLLVSKARARRSGR